MNIKHTILMITYNQESYIGEALDSLLTQRVLPNEIFISDDCSTDQTVRIIASYQEKFPEIIKLSIQKKNLGIYKNLNSMLENIKVGGDIITYLAGDDLFESGVLEEFSQFVSDNNLNPLEDKFMIMTNQLNIELNGEKKLAIDNYKLRNKNYLKLRLRNRIGNRYSGFSRAIFNSFQSWNEDFGLWADAIHGFDLYSSCDKFYFINKAFPIYRLGSGITSKVGYEKLATSWIKVAEYILENRKKKLDIFDIIFLRKSICMNRYGIEKNINSWSSYFIYYSLSFIDVITGYNSLREFVIELANFLPKNISDPLKTFFKKVVYGRKN